MGDDQFQLGSGGGGGWWDTTTRTTPPASISMTLNTIASFGSTAAAADQSSAAADQNLQMMGLGLSSQNLDWNQALFRGEKAVESSFRSLLQEDYHHQQQQQQQQINRPSFSLDQTTPFSSQAASSNDSTITSAGGGGGGGFQVDFHGMLLPDNNQPTYQSRSPMSYQYPPGGGGGGGGYAAADLQFMRTTQPPDAVASGGGHLHFSNNTPFWNASAPPPDGRSSFFPAGLQIPPPPPPPLFDDMSSKQDMEMREMNGITTKKNNSSSTDQTSNKRPRGNEAAAPLPAFKVKKEKMGDRITALQQLVSPFGKTDTASVLSEAIAYIKFLHEQVNVLSNPYMKNGVPIQQQHHHHQINGDHKSKEQEGPRQDLRSRGLCLVPVSSTFPMTHETTVDFWTPTFGGTFR